MTAANEWEPSGFLEPYNQPVVTIFQIMNVRYESPKIVHDLRLYLEKLAISCSAVSKGTKAKNIKNGKPYVGQDIDKSTAESMHNMKYFISEI